VLLWKDGSNGMLFWFSAHGERDRDAVSLMSGWMAQSGPTRFKPRPQGFQRK